ncbi:hydrolase 1, exosortase A system-associated [Blastomonas fulva]|uniref:Hydrolase 1, exosortase A system-associated n=1 Tax=Blastomonas fulva TaxID=1550728 RepID=A0ABN5BAA5_9SPHN|nr:hydrolase 1, exosortase A system-associated [Blastomonas fulva]ASR53278.1 hydrolase 1, exosortase A system-associated [Blastomonas fulva]
MRQHFTFDCAGDTLTATLDGADSTTGLLIVSGGNEIRSGAHAGMAALAAAIAAAGHPVMRYDRRGIGDSTGENAGFESTSDDIAAAVQAMRTRVPSLARLVAFGNCDAASALALYGPAAGIDALVLANMWTLESESDEPDEAEAAATMTAGAIRSRYLAKLKNPRELWRLASGGVDIGKLVRGLRQAAAKTEVTGLAAKLGQALAEMPVPAKLLVAEHDRTAMWFLEHWDSAPFAAARANAGITMARLDSGSHSFASAGDKAWLRERILEALT